jgi:hypothetical protein
MERHGHLTLDVTVKEKLLRISASPIDRALTNIKKEIDGSRLRRPGVGSAIRRSIPVRTFDDWGHPPPGYFEVDMVEHCGGIKHGGNYVHSLVLTDIATGWTKCIAMPVRNQSIIVVGFEKAAKDLPFPIIGIDTANDSAFMNQTVFGYWKAHSIEQTRSRAYKSNDNAWAEQKNGAVVRRLVGYGKLAGLRATHELGRMYAASRLYINFFQPSLKLKSKVRDGARVSKQYHSPMTPCNRILALSSVDEATKIKLRLQFDALDPVLRLKKIREGQKKLRGLVDDVTEQNSEVGASDIETFLKSLSTAWRYGEIRPTHRKPSPSTRWWKTRVDPSEHAWPVMEQWLISDPL